MIGVSLMYLKLIQGNSTAFSQDIYQAGNYSRKESPQQLRGLFVNSKKIKKIKTLNKGNISLCLT